jgi:hypothetical protein
MGSKHTPGPWRVEASKFRWGIYNIVTVENEKRVAEVLRGEEPEGLANARLIARAPKLDEDNKLLLEACKLAYPFLLDNARWSHHEAEIEAAEKLEAAIDAAEADE